MSGDAPRPDSAATLRIVLDGVVDRATVGTVAEEVRTVIAHTPHVEVDVTGVDRWENDALNELAACARIGPGIEILMGGRGRPSGPPR